jgi:hypothetical protein
MTSWVRARGGIVVVVAGLIAGGSAGCHSASNAISAPGAAGVTGNWEFTATSNNGATVPIGAYLKSSGDTIYGAGQVQKEFSAGCEANGCCGGPFAEFDRLITGTLDGAGNIALKSQVPGGGPVFTMTGSADGDSRVQGNFSLTGACPAQGTITGFEIPLLHGTYSGMMTSSQTGKSFQVSATLEQGTKLNQQGFFSLSGTSTLTGYPCLKSARIAAPLDRNSALLGNKFQVSMNAASGGAMIGLSGRLVQDGQALAATYAIVGGGCSNDFGMGTLGLQ